MKEKKSEVRHLPMRLEPATLNSISDTTTSQSENDAKTASNNAIKNDNISQQPPQQSATTTTTRPADSTTSSRASSLSLESEVIDDAHKEEEESTEIVINPVGPNEAIIFSSDGAVKFTLPDDDDESFFQHTLDDIKGRYKALRLEVKDVDEGEELLTTGMRQAREEGEKLALMARYKSVLLRIQFPSRHTVQGVFKPHNSIGEIKDWLRPLLTNPELPIQLYIVPPRTELENSSTLLDLKLVPASLIHFSSPASKNEDYIKKEYLENLSNVQGANKAGSQFRKGAKRRETGISGEVRIPEKLETIPENSRAGKRGSPSEGPSVPSQTTSMPKMPKWFKPGK